MSKDSLRFIRNEDGSFVAEWDKEDPEWAFLNHLTGKEIEVIMKQAIQDYENDH